MNKDNIFKIKYLHRSWWLFVLIFAAITIAPSVAYANI